MSRYECFVVNDSDVTPISCDDINEYDFSLFFVQTCLIFTLIFCIILIRPIVLYCVPKCCCFSSNLQQESPLLQEKEIQCDIDCIHQIIIHPDESFNLTEAL
jgi:hypothetical protein